MYFFFFCVVILFLFCCLTGFGMKQIPFLVHSRKLSTLYLSTLGQENFYKKLGYYECEPVSLYAFGLSSNPRPQCNEKSENSENEVTALCDLPTKASGDDLWNENKPLNISNSIPKSRISTTVNEKKCAPPPPPPLPITPIGKGVMTVKTHMKKNLSKS